VIEPEPPKEPPKPPEPEPEPEKPIPAPPKPDAKPDAKPRVAHPMSVATISKDAPPSDHAVVTDGTDEPVFGVSMESTSQQGGPAVAVGNTLTPGTPAAPAKQAAKPAGPPTVAAYEATKLPLPQGRCFGTYTDEAKAAGIEGTVVLDLTVDEAGHAHDVTVVKGLEHGLSAAALTALKGCQFTPGEKDGKPVAVRVKGFKVTFALQDAR
jgi:protein TonB